MHNTEHVGSRGCCENSTRWGGGQALGTWLALHKHSGILMLFLLATQLCLIQILFLLLKVIVQDPVVLPTSLSPWQDGHQFLSFRDEGTGALAA